MGCFQFSLFSFHFLRSLQVKSEENEKWKPKNEKRKYIQNEASIPSLWRENMADDDLAETLNLENLDEFVNDEKRIVS